MTGIEKIRTTRGLASKIARALDISPQAVSDWVRVPPAHVLKVEAVSGISRHQLRPDIYPIERKRAS
jgi:DNA-binding transcriptional regulator YdaS (Cro superfamily)